MLAERGDVAASVLDFLRGGAKAHQMVVEGAWIVQPGQVLRMFKIERIAEQDAEVRDG